MFTQDIGSKEDTELNGQGLTLSWRELSVETPGHCQSVGNWTSSPEWRAGNAANTQRLRWRYYRFHVMLSNRRLAELEGCKPMPDK
jgi:hypothetical protein